MLTGFMIPDHALRMFGGSCRSLFFQCREKVWRTRKKKKVYRPVFRALSGWYWVIHQDNISRSKRRLCSLLFPPFYLHIWPVSFFYQSDSSHSHTRWSTVGKRLKDSGLWCLSNHLQPLCHSPPGGTCGPVNRIKLPFKWNLTHLCQCASSCVQLLHGSCRGPGLPL